MRARASLALACLTAAAAATAQTPPMSPEIPVNTFTTNEQQTRAGAVAMDHFGRFILVWGSFGQDGDANSIIGRAFDADGTPLSAEFPINAYTTGNQGSPVVAGDSRGDFVVAWHSTGQDGDGYGIFARRVDANGVPSAEFQVNTYTTGSQRLPAIASNRSGRFVIVWWDSDGHDGDGGGIFGQLYDDNAQAVGAEFPVNTYTTGEQRYPAVAMNAAGNFVVAWESAGPDGDGYGIEAQLYDPTGAPVGGEIAVNSYTTGDQRLPAVQMDRSGNFVVVWESHGSDGSATGVAGRRFDPSGAPLTGEFQVNTYTTDYQSETSLAMDADGNFVVSWGSYTQDGDKEGVFARAFNASGTATSPEFQVNTTTTNNQQNPTVATNGRGQFVIGWESEVTDTGDVVTRVGAPMAIPLALDVHSPGTGTFDLNGVWENGETVIIEPRYKNTLAAPFAMTGVAANLTGPIGPSYVLKDGTADYNEIPAGVANDCFTATGDCYVATITAAVRPAQHWDAELDELLSTGITKTWQLHIGESFPDVPRSQQFYAFIENLFHHGITSGCGGGNYCPDNPVTRAQMAVFLLKSEHDAGYTPPACAGIFPDVACPSPFADWIEQLFHESITGGCGGGNYCPGNPVTRGQMAVFLLKTEHGASYTPPTCTGIFPDVPCPSQFADWIEQLFAEQITGGCGGGNYCPANPVTRGQMAVFLDKTVGFSLYSP